MSHAVQAHDSAPFELAVVCSSPHLHETKPNAMVHLTWLRESLCGSTCPDASQLRLGHHSPLRGVPRGLTCILLNPSVNKTCAACFWRANSIWRSVFSVGDKSK